MEKTTYCVRERKRTGNVPGSEEVEYTSRGQPIYYTVCASCGARKAKFLKRSTMQGSGVDIHKQILKVAPKKGLTLPGHKYTGPGNPLEQQLRYDPDTGEILEIYEQPTGSTDAIAMQHDVDYSVCERKGLGSNCKREADRKMVKALDAIPWKQRQWGHALARNMIQGKQKLGLGVQYGVGRKKK